jgi:hypothetical protein
MKLTQELKELTISLADLRFNSPLHGISLPCDE